MLTGRVFLDGVEYFNSSAVYDWTGQHTFQEKVAFNNQMNLGSGNTIMKSSGLIDKYNSVSGLMGFGVGAFVGLDNRTGKTAVDASPITLFTTTSSTSVFKILFSIIATAYTSGTPAYVLTWTEGGVAKTSTQTSTGSLGTTALLIQPDTGTNITVQITAIGVATVNVSAIVEQVA